MEELEKLTKDRNKLLAISGILHSQRAFVGPEVLHIDLTNRCNFNCLACWCRSPLLEDKAMPDWEKKLIIPFGIIRSIFDDLDNMGGLRQVKLVGGGEPFMHPDILSIVEYIKGKGKNIEIDINTNFSLVTKEIAEKLIELGVDSLTVSLWAGTPGIYAAVHPNQTEATFKRIGEVLRFIKAQKLQLKVDSPRVIIHDVILNRNYTDLKQMIDFALDVGADDIQFVPVDPVKDRTEGLLLNDSEKEELLLVLNDLKTNYDSQTFKYTKSDGRSIKLSDFNGFMRRIEMLNTASGSYDENVVDEIPCYVGWLFARIMATGNVVPCCKGHRMTMGNVYKNSFKEIWNSFTYNEFRSNCIKLSKTDPYFLKIGNDAAVKTGCYNCDNLWQNIPMHKKLTSLRNKNPQLVSFCDSFIKSLF